MKSEIPGASSWLIQIYTVVFKQDTPCSEGKDLHILSVDMIYLA